MPVFNPDFSEAYKPITPGTYQARVSGYATGKSDNTGHMYIKWDIDVIGGEHDGHSLRHNTMLAGKGSGMLQQFLALCIPGYENGPFDAADVVGSRLSIAVGEEEYNGKKLMKIKSVSAPTYEQENHERF